MAQPNILASLDPSKFDPASFLRDHWQQQPLLIRNPWADWRNPVEPAELAGLACEPAIESRLIVQGAKRTKVEAGPFDAARFATLGKRPWTLLVQAVDHHVAAVADLIAPFRFIPDWRIDDVMVSYASDGGGVGPHYDQYDVFLIQGLGQRRWRIGARCDAATPLLPNDDLRLIADFAPTEEWVLDPGDILYVPPGFAHDGAAVGDDCMTYSVGFRAPSRAELIGQWCEDLLPDMPEDDRYGDPGLTAQANPGEIGVEAIDRLHAMVTEALGDRAAFAHWFGRYSSTPKYPEIDWAPEEALTPKHLRKALARGARLSRNPASRFAFVRDDEGSIALFVDGECYPCEGETAALAEQLCAQTLILPDPVLADSAPVRALLTLLIDRGSLALDADD